MSKLKKIHLKQYGKFEDYSLNFNPGFNAFYGINEAGKSTVVDSFKTTFFGFMPANTDKHPYTPWQAESLELSGEFEDQTVTRRMGRSINGKLIRGNEISTINNRSIPQVSHASRDLYESVFSLSTDDLVSIEGKSWEEVEDKVLLNYDSKALKAPKAVIAQLDSEIDRIWRTTARGNTEMKRLSGAIKSLKSDIRERHIKDMAFKDMLEREVDLLEVQSKLIADIKYVSITIGTYEETLEARGILKKMNELKADFNNRDAFLSMPKDLKIKYEQVNDQLNILNEVQSQAMDEQGDLKQQIIQIPQMYEDVKSIKDQLPTLMSKYRTFLTGSAMLKEKLSRVKVIGQQLDKGLTASHLKREHLNNIKTLDILTLKALVHQRDLAHGDTNEKKVTPWGFFAMLILGLAFALLGYNINQEGLLYIAIFLIGVGMTGFFMNRTTESSGQSEGYKLLISEIDSHLSPFGLDEAVAKGCTVDWLDRIGNLQGSVIEYLTLHREVKDQKASQSALKEELLKGAQCPVGFDLESWFGGLESLIAEGEMKTVSNGHIKDQLLKVEKEIAQAENEKQELLIQKFQIESHFLKFNEALSEGIELYNKNVILHDKWKVYNESYENLDKGFSFRDKMNQVTIEEDEYIELKESLDVLQSELKIAQVELAEIEVEKKHELSGDDIKVLIGRLKALEDEKEELTEKRNRLIIEREVIRLADHKYQEDNKPQVVEKASGYLNKLTLGKYEGLYLDESHKLFVKTKEGPKSIEEAFSQGTKHQIYLSFRLGLMDLLDPEYKLPLILDDCLVHFDHGRMEQALLIFKELSKSRQILFFTCHTFYRDYLYDKMGINVVSI